MDDLDLINDLDSFESDEDERGDSLKTVSGKEELARASKEMEKMNEAVDDELVSHYALKKIRFNPDNSRRLISLLYQHLEDWFGIDPKQPGSSHNDRVFINSNENDDKELHIVSFEVLQGFGCFDELSWSDVLTGDELKRTFTDEEIALLNSDPISFYKKHPLNLDTLEDEFNEVVRLAYNIFDIGGVVSPVELNFASDAVNMQLTHGHRRTLASYLALKTDIRAIIKRTSDHEDEYESAKRRYSENGFFKSLTTFELILDIGDVRNKYRDKFGSDPEIKTLSSVFSMDRHNLSSALRFLDEAERNDKIIPPLLYRAVTQNLVSLTPLKLILRGDGLEQREKLTRLYLEKGVSALKKGLKQKATPKAGRKVTTAPLKITDVAIGKRLADLVVKEFGKELAQFGVDQNIKVNDIKGIKTVLDALTKLDANSKSAGKS